ncbi:hypothetical protein GCM10009647_061510 [Streptomyces sanglieri]
MLLLLLLLLLNRTGECRYRAGGSGAPVGGATGGGARYGRQCIAHAAGGGAACHRK